MSDGTGRQAMAAQSGTSDNPKSSNQESSKKPKTLGKYLLVSATQTIVEFGSFTLLHVLSVPSAIANGVAITDAPTRAAPPVVDNSGLGSNIVFNDFGPPPTLEELGAVLGISKERVRQIENRALEKLKAVLVGKTADFAQA